MGRALVTCCLIVVTFDAIASFTSLLTQIPYGWFSIPQFAMYVAMGYLLYHSFELDKEFFIILLCASACEATIGWWVSALIGPGKPPGIHVGLMVFSAVFVVALDTTLGVLGRWIAKARSGPRT
jgi:hypothetical protein